MLRVLALNAKASFCVASTVNNYLIPQVNKSATHSWLEKLFVHLGCSLKVDKQPLECCIDRNISGRRGSELAEQFHMY